ncbi:MAG: ABC-2 family transporter protein [Planctomycetes bacterium]|nr:ABC-2 family transporter protein [Planctomycetota bacterium]
MADAVLQAPLPHRPREPSRLHPYLWLMRLTFLKLMAYRMRYVTGIATYAVFVGGQYAIWKAIFAAKSLGADGRIGGMTLHELTTYLAIGYISRAAYFTNTDSEIAARFQSGDVTLDLLKPLDFHGQWLAQAAGETAFRICFFALPMSVVLLPLFGVLPPSGDGWWQFPLLFALAFAINAELNLLAGTASFFLEDITGLMSLKRNTIMLLSGLMVPLTFLPAWLAKTTLVLPFALISYYPSIAYTGKLGTDGVPGCAHVLILGLAWLVALRAANVWLWRRARGRLEVQGG